MSEEMSKETVNIRVDEMNAMALAANLEDLRLSYDKRIEALENDISTLRNLIAKQSQVIGQALQHVMGAGSTVLDPHPEDKR